MPLSFWYSVDNFHKGISSPAFKKKKDQGGFLHLLFFKCFLLKIMPKWYIWGQLFLPPFATYQCYNCFLMNYFTIITILRVRQLSYTGEEMKTQSIQSINGRLQSWWMSELGFKPKLWLTVHQLECILPHFKVIWRGLNSDGATIFYQSTPSKWE